MLERITVIALLCSGASIAFYNGNLSTVLNEAEEIKPTIFTRFGWIFISVNLVSMILIFFFISLVHPDF
jgi:hypothetical protein